MVHYMSWVPAAMEDSLRPISLAYLCSWPLDISQLWNRYLISPQRQARSQVLPFVSNLASSDLTFFLAANLL